jgi:protein-S-isoprenylcysteine O-methyltransferase Ste14
MSADIFTIVLSSLWLGSEIALMITKRAQTPQADLDKSSLRALWGTIACSIVAGVCVRFVNIGHFGGDPLTYFVIGITLIIAGSIVRWSAIFTLKSAFTVDVSIDAHQHLVRTGIYRFVRHPAYSGSLLSFLGLGIAFGSYLSLLAIIVPIGSAFLYRIHVEEKALLNAFGEEYIAYRASTGRLIPRLY